MSRNLEIANTIKTQLYALDKMQMWGMGAKKFIAIENGLRFSVNGAQHKGLVEITLDEAKDLYKVEFVKMGRKINQEMKALGIKSYDQVRKVIRSLDEVFAEDLTEILDRYAY